jgi:hypothetical protein
MDLGSHLGGIAFTVRLIHSEHMRSGALSALGLLALTQPLNTIRSNPRCTRYASNGFYILKQQQGKWKEVFNGSVEPPCSLKIPVDRVVCRK